MSPATTFVPLPSRRVVRWRVVGISSGSTTSGFSGATHGSVVVVLMSRVSGTVVVVLPAVWSSSPPSRVITPTMATTTSTPPPIHSPTRRDFALRRSLASSSRRSLRLAF